MSLASEKAFGSISHLNFGSGKAMEKAILEAIQEANLQAERDNKAFWLATAILGIKGFDALSWTDEQIFQYQPARSPLGNISPSNFNAVKEILIELRNYSSLVRMVAREIKVNPDKMRQLEEIADAKSEQANKALERDCQLKILHELRAAARR